MELLHKVKQRVTKDLL